MTEQEHGGHAFLALLLKAASGTEAPLRAWRRKLGRITREPLEAGCLSAFAACNAELRAS